MDLIYRLSELKHCTAIILCVFAVGCAASKEQEAMRSISVGMSREQVLSHLGMPDDVWLEGDGVAMQYDIHTVDTGKTLQCMGAAFGGQFLPGCNGEDYNVPFVVHLRDDKVIGYQQLKQAPSPQTQLYPGPQPSQAAPSQLPGRMLMCANGQYVYGTRCQMAPDGSYVGVP